MSPTKIYYHDWDELYHEAKALPDEQLIHAVNHLAVGDRSSFAMGFVRSVVDHFADYDTVSTAQRVPLEKYYANRKARMKP